MLEEGAVQAAHALVPVHLNEFTHEVQGKGARGNGGLLHKGRPRLIGANGQAMGSGNVFVLLQQGHGLQMRQGE